MGDLRVPVGLDISDADAAVGEVKDPKTFYAGAVPKKTGTMPTVAIVAGSNAYPAGYHDGDGGGLDAIDTDLAVGNIKKDVVIFGLTGTFESTLTAEAQSVTEVITGDSEEDFTTKRQIKSLTANGTITILTKTDTFSTTSLALAFFAGACQPRASTSHKAQIFMDSVQVSESAFLNVTYDNILLVGSRALSGSKTIEGKIKDYSGSTGDFKWYTRFGSSQPMMYLSVGSVKI